MSTIENFEKNKPECSSTIPDYDKCIQMKFCDKCLKTPGCGWCLNKCIPGDKSSAHCKSGPFSCILDNWSYTLGECYFKPSSTQIVNQIGTVNPFVQQIKQEEERKLQEKYKQEFEAWQNRY